jgi:hypothetical protein
VTRVYVPATDADLHALVAGTTLAAPRVAYAVTPALRAWAGAGGAVDDEEAELVALSEAARHSLRLLAAAGGGDRRVVLAADLPTEAVTVADEGDEGPGVVRLGTDVGPDAVAAVQLDDDAAAGAVVAAAGAVAAADAGDPAAEAVVAALDDHDLLWYDPAELGSLVPPG